MTAAGSVGKCQDIFKFRRISIPHARRLKRLNDAKNR